MINKIVHVCVLFFFLLPVPVTAQREKNFSVIAYYTGNGENIREYDISRLTHVIYSFLHLDGDTLSFRNEQQRQILIKLTSLKQEFPKLKILVSLGGWGGCKTCSEIFSTDSGRLHFSQSVAKILRETNADGIDLDWEYPVIEGYPGHPYSPLDKENFTSLLKSLRNQFGNKYELSFAAGGFTQYIQEAIDWPSVWPLVDRINLMTYDLVNGFSNQTGHHTPLFGNRKQTESGDHCIRMLLAKGVPPGKLVLGAAFYGRTWDSVNKKHRGIYQSGHFKAFVPWKNFRGFISDSSGFRVYYDKKAKASWAYNKKTREFSTFDDKPSIAAKTEYVINMKLGGIMFWELTLDAPPGELLQEIYKGLNSP